MTRIYAKLSYLHIAPRKVRLLANLIRGKRFVQAEEELLLANKRAASPLLKLLRSAGASAKSSGEESVANLYVKMIRVDQGPAYKRSLPRSRGRTSLLKKITSHVHIELGHKEEKKKGVGKRAHETGPERERGNSGPERSRRAEPVKNVAKTL